MVLNQVRVAFSALCLLALVGCNGIGEKESLLARIDKEQVYREDVAMLLKNDPSEKKDMGQFLYTNLFAKAAVTSWAVKEFPELGKMWDEYYQELEPRLLTMVYQNFFMMECLGFSENELKRFYGTHKDLFKENADFIDVRGMVAAEYYIQKHKEEFEKYLKDNGAGDSSAVDTTVLKNRFVEDYRQSVRTTSLQEVVKKQRVEVLDAPVISPERFYEKHKDMFMTVPGYELYHIQNRDSAALAKLFPETPDLETFKKVAFRSSKNKLTARDSGYVGVVKNEFALPYGIGMVEKLGVTLDGKEPGFVTGVLSSKTEGASEYHLFYLSKKIASQLKPLDRVSVGIAKDIENGNIFEIDSNTALISCDGETLFTEKDLLAFNEKYSHQRLSKTVHGRLVNMFAEIFAFSMEAKDLKLDHSWEFRSLVRLSRLIYINEQYLNKAQRLDQIPEDSLKSLYEKYGNPITPSKTYENSLDDMKRLAFLPANIYNREYLYGYRIKYAKRSLKMALNEIYGRCYGDYLNLWKKRVSAELYAKASVHFYNSEYSEFQPRMTVDEMLADADSLAKAGLPVEALVKYRDLMYVHADNDSIFQKASYEIAQLKSEIEEFYDAESGYYAFYKMYPESPLAEKALFSRGFILNENLHKNETALAVFKEFQQKYPNSELKESVDWLVRNIESDGKLAEELMKKIESEE